MAGRRRHRARRGSHGGSRARRSPPTVKATSEPRARAPGRAIPPAPRPPAAAEEATAARAAAGAFGAGGGETYGSAVLPVDLGSGGGNNPGCNVLATSNAGGGAVALSVSGTLRLDGDDPRRRHSRLPPERLGGGAGGSILVESGILIGSGLFSAEGADAGSGNAGGGGGGRIAVYAARGAAFGGRNDLERRGGSGFADGEPGTLRFVDSQCDGDCDEDGMVTVPELIRRRRSRALEGVGPRLRVGRRGRQRFGVRRRADPSGQSRARRMRGGFLMRRAAAVFFSSLPRLCLSVLVCAVACSDDDNTLRLVGSVERTLVELTAAASEVIVSLPVERGQHVQAGATVVKLDPTLAEAEVARVEAEVAGARTRQSVTRRDLERAQDLRRRKIVSEDQLEHAQLAWDEASARLSEAEARLTMARKHLADTTIAVAGRRRRGSDPVRPRRARSGRRRGRGDPAGRGAVGARVDPRARRLARSRPATAAEVRDRRFRAVASRAGSSTWRASPSSRRTTRSPSASADTWSTRRASRSRTHRPSCGRAPRRRSSSGSTAPAEAAP